MYNVMKPFLFHFIMKPRTELIYNDDRQHYTTSSCLFFFVRAKKMQNIYVYL